MGVHLNKMMFYMLPVLISLDAYLSLQRSRPCSCSPKFARKGKRSSRPREKGLPFGCIQGAPPPKKNNNDQPHPLLTARPPLLGPDLIRCLTPPKEAWYGYVLKWGSPKSLSDTFSSQSKANKWYPYRDPIRVTTFRVVARKT